MKNDPHPENSGFGSGKSGKSGKTGNPGNATKNHVAYQIEAHNQAG